MALPQTSSDQNVAQPERWGSVAAGALLTYFGLKRSWLGTALLGGAGAALAYRGITGHCPVYERTGITTASSKLTSVEAEEAVTVQATPREVYDLWRDVERFPAFMRHLEQVEERGEGRSQWTARAPKDLTTVSWEAEITADEPGERIAWRSLPGSEIENSGTVRFSEAPNDGATEVHVHITYRLPEAATGSVAAKLLNPAFEQLVKNDVRRFKHLMETGEVPTIEGQPHGG